MAKPSGMSDGPDSLVLNLLRAISSDISQIKDDITELKERIGFEGDYASLLRSVDRMVGDAGQINTRLGIAAALDGEEEDPWMISDNV
jgi:hypothetical protein